MCSINPLVSSHCKLSTALFYSNKKNTKIKKQNKTQIGATQLTTTTRQLSIMLGLSTERTINIQRGGVVQGREVKRYFQIPLIARRASAQSHIQNQTSTRNLSRRASVCSISLPLLVNNNILQKRVEEPLPNPITKTRRRRGIDQIPF